MPTAQLKGGAVALRYAVGTAKYTSSDLKGDAGIIRDAVRTEKHTSADPTGYLS